MNRERKPEFRSSLFKCFCNHSRVLQPRMEGQTFSTYIKPPDFVFLSNAPMPSYQLVKFSFKPEEKIEENFARVEGKSFDLYGNNWQYPDSEFLKVNNIQVGKVLNGSLRAIASGTCTPVLFDFPSLQHR